MKIKIYDSKYKKVSSLVMESRKLIITIIPQSGGKIQSIYDKLFDKEYLYQSPKNEFKNAVYGMPYTDGDLSGFDEAFPTIEECYYPLYPWHGIHIPDHGELWALSWDFNISGTEINLNTNGVKFPYSIRKKIKFLMDNTFRISYQIMNHSNFDYHFMWAPHCLFICDKDTRIILPPSVESIISTCNVTNKLGDYGAMHKWPVTSIKGQEYDISKIYPKYPGKCEKYFAVGYLREGWCALHGAETKNVIGLSYPIEKVPYLGVWEGIMNGVYVTALEPCTSDLDALSTAILWRRSSVVKAGAVYDWHLNMTFDKIEEVKLIDIDGKIR
jgi:hypothetical protein